MGYRLLDVGAGRRLERFGEHVVDRPHPAAEGTRRSPESWVEADLLFDREVGWSGPGLAAAQASWTTQLDALTLQLRPTDAGQVGLFPEHAEILPWILARARERERDRPNVLNLFAYTGLATLALAAVGVAVAHVDAAKPAIDWARRNAALNGLDDRPIRWLIDDVPAFVAREVRRGHSYDGVVLDPPTYGHGPSGKAWRLERDLPPLLDDIARLLRPDGFLVVTAHSAALDPFALGAFIGSGVEVGELAIRATSGAVLPLGAFARLARAS